jgi:4-amino-4-deoxy-L-arabinose transferase-like glycosyltransferase
VQPPERYLTALKPLWRLLQQPQWSAFLLLLPLVALLPAIPIDETRYVAVAWEMHLSGNYLVPHLNGKVYADKPPLLFWAINAGWWLTGVQLWTARAVVALFSLLSLVLLQRLTQRLTGSDVAARASGWILLGSIYFAAFATAIMFDVVLVACVLLAAHGICDLVYGTYRRGILFTGAAIGLGILAKGPVMLLHVMFIGLAAPWWSCRLDGNRRGYYTTFAAAVFIGIAIALAWAVPAALHGGPDYARSIFLEQTIDRVQGVGSEAAHRRPFWFYLVVFPLMLLPWPLLLRGRWLDLKRLANEPAVRLALVWVLPALLVFSLIAGKQSHYLLPLLPAVALACATAFAKDTLTIRTGLLAAVLAIVGVTIATAPFFVSLQSDYANIGQPLALVLAAVLCVGAGFAWASRNASSPTGPTLAVLAMAVVIQLLLLRVTGSYDVTPIADRIRMVQESDQPVATLGWHHGVFEFAGRLRQPLREMGSLSEFAAWAGEYPDGFIVSFYRKYRFAATPVFTQPFLGAEASMWRARDAAAAGIDATATHLGQPDASADERVD